MKDKSSDTSRAGEGHIEHRFNIGYLYPPAVGLTGLLSMLLVSDILRKGRLPMVSLTGFAELNFTASLQLYILPISFLVIGLIFFYDRRNFSLFFRPGDTGAKTEPLKLLGITGEDTWKKVGVVIALILTAGTLVFMTTAVVRTGGVMNLMLLKFLPFILIFSATNAWSEEMFARFTVVAGLAGRLKPRTIFWISAAIFGIPHYFGTPGGPVGVLMAGFLGWLLAKAVYETRGMFWAWFIHFVQDVVIFSANVMILAGTLG